MHLLLKYRLTLLIYILLPVIGFSQRTATVRGANVNVRACSELDCQILFQLNTGDECTILFNMKDERIIGYGINSWYKIEAKGDEGFIYGAFLDFISDDLKVWKSNVAGGHGVVNGNEVNARSCAGLLCNKSFQLNSGDAVRVLGKTKEYFIPGLGKQPWYELEYQGHKGFVFSHFVNCTDCDFLSSGNTTANTSTVKKATVIGDNVNIRSCASKNCDVLFQLSVGEQCHYVSTVKDINPNTSDSWCEINYKAQQGFVAEKYLSIPSNVTRPVKIWAVIAGVADYSALSNAYGVSDLNYSAQDAKLIYQFLKSPEGGNLPDDQIILLRNTEATKDNILTNAKNLFTRAGPNDLIIVYFSGHGGPNFFLAHDRPLKYAEMKQVIESSPAQRRICIADACYSGTWSKNAQVNQTQKVLNSAQLERLYYDALSSSGNGIALFMSSANNETSLEVGRLGQGLFTHYYIEGLKGYADADNNKIITIGELSEFVSRKVKKIAWEGYGHLQSPNISGYYDADMPVGVVR